MMKANVKSQIADYFQYVDEEQGRVGVGSIVEPVTPVLQLAPHRTRTWRRAALAAIAAGVGTFVVIGVLLLADPFSGSDMAPLPPASPTPIEPTVPLVEEPPVAPPEQTVTPETGAPDPEVSNEPQVETPPVEPAGPVKASISWTRLEDATGALSGDGDQFLQAITAGGPGFIAVGAECPVSCPWVSEGEWQEDFIGSAPGWDSWTAAVWVSENGLEWERVPHDEAVFGGAGDEIMLDVVAGGPGLVAVGMTDEWLTGGDLGPGLTDGVIWTSADGLTWERVPDPDGVFSGPGDQRIEAVIAGGPGLIAVGFSGGPDGFTGVEATVWVSADGLVWEMAEITDSAIREGTTMHDVVAGGPGFVAVGVDYTVFEYPDTRDAMAGAVWVSADGRTWERVSPYDPSFGGQPESHPDAYTVLGGDLFMYSVALYDGGLVAGGHGADRAIWISPNGHEWTRIPDDDPGWDARDGLQQPIRAFVVDGDRLDHIGPTSDNRITVWGDTSRRFEVTRTRFYPIEEMVDALVAGDLIIAVGTSGPDGAIDAAIWVGEWEN